MNRDEALDELNLGPGATEAEIRAAHRALARERHPDVSEGDEDGTDEMKRLNQARDVALRNAKDVNAESRQELVLRDLFEMQSGREAREAARDRGRELVAGAATVEVGRLEKLQRQASVIAVVAIVAAATVALIRSSGSHQGTVITPVVGALGVLAILAGALRSLLNEEIKRIQLSLDELGTELARRQTYAAVFGAIVNGLLDRLGFQEEELLNAVSLWMRGARAQAEVENGGHPSMIGLSELRDLTATSQRRLLVFVLQNDIRWFRSPTGIKIETADLVRVQGSSNLEEMQFDQTDPNAIEEAIGLALEQQKWQLDRGLPPLSRANSFADGPPGPVRLRRFVQRLFGGRGAQQDPERRLRDLVAQVGEVDVSRLVLGKGLENGLLSESEEVVSGGGLLTTYRLELSGRADSPRPNT